jgi:hypothetical protein
MSDQADESARAFGLAPGAHRQVGRNQLAPGGGGAATAFICSCAASPSAPYSRRLWSRIHWWTLRPPASSIGGTPRHDVAGDGLPPHNTGARRLPQSGRTSDVVVSRSFCHHRIRWRAAPSPTVTASVPAHPDRLRKACRPSVERCTRQLDFFRSTASRMLATMSAGS